jgi:GR25 family glycosyltransferase involved in LPS biosynthesis
VRTADVESHLLVNEALALDDLSNATWHGGSLVTAPSAASFLPKVFVIVLTADEGRMSHFDKHIRRHLPEAEQFEAFYAKKYPVATAIELDRMGVTLSTSKRNWIGRILQGLQVDYSWVSTALVGEIGVLASQIGVWERVATSDPKEVPYALVLEDDAVLLPSFHRDVVRNMVAELDQGVGTEDSSSDWHVAYGQ